LILRTLAISEPPNKSLLQINAMSAALLHRIVICGVAMENRDRLLKRDPLRLVVVRKSLKTVAECLSDLDFADADRYMDTLIEELKMLRQRDASSLVWSQVTSVISDGPQSYGLERIGLWPESK
jgi:hypothetical protein